MIFLSLMCHLVKPEPGFNRCYRKSVMPIAVSVAVMVAGRWEWQVVGVVNKLLAVIINVLVRPSMC